MLETREMDCPRTQVNGGKVEWVDGSGKDYYKFTETRKQITDGLVDWWDKLEPNADDGPPVALQDKQARPCDRSYPTKDQIKEASRRLFKK